MAFNPTSPGVYISETNVSTIVPTIASTVGAISGIFNWGPLFSPTFMTTEKDLVQKFGKPNANNYETWFSAANFLHYADQLYVVRTAIKNIVANSTMNNVPNSAIIAVGGTNGGTVNLQEKISVTKAGFNFTTFTNFIESNQTAPNTLFSARYAGNLGNSIRVGCCTGPNQYHSLPTLSGTIATGASAGNSYVGLFTISPGSRVGKLVFTAGVGSNVASGNLYANTFVPATFSSGDYFQLNIGGKYQYIQAASFSNAVTNSTATAVTVNFNAPFSGGYALSQGTVSRYWEYYKVAPLNGKTFISAYQANSSLPTMSDLLKIVIVDQYGYITGTPNTVLKVYDGLSRSTDALDNQNASIYFKTVINQSDEFIRVYNDIDGYVSNTANALVASTGGTSPLNVNLTGGSDGDSETTAPISTLIDGWSLFQSADDIKINLIIAGKSVGQSNQTAGDIGATYGNYDMADWLINNLAKTRKDCVLFFSPDKSLVVNNNNDISTDLINWAGLITSSDRAFLDGSYKYQEDSYNSVFRWVPFNGDIAGLCVYTDTVSYPWFSPAGFNRGQLANATKIAWNPNQGERDIIYPNAINPIVRFQGQGTYLYGDRTFTTQPSAFDRINVRRMFLYIEQAIKIAARYTLFEINDVFTQNAFKNMVTPFLKSVQSNRGITDFQVICDGTINTPFVVDSNQFLCAILVKPARSINFINISFFAVPDGVDFSTVPLTF
jgi:hypothetical protein